MEGPDDLGARDGGAMTGGLLFELPGGWAVALDVAVWGAWSAAAGYACHSAPAARFTRDTWLTRPRGFERGGAWYQQRLRIKRWKDRLPEAGALFAGGFSKRRLVRRDPAYLSRFAAETRRAELTHWTTMVVVPVFVLWNPWWACSVMVAYAALANLPCIAAQRYNRARLERMLGARVRTGPGDAQTPQISTARPNPG